MMAARYTWFFFEQMGITRKPHHVGQHRLQWWLEFAEKFATPKPGEDDGVICDYGLPLVGAMTLRLRGFALREARESPLG